MSELDHLRIADFSHSWSVQYMYGAYFENYDSPSNISLTARVKALPLAEQAVSVLSDGPLKSNANDILLGIRAFKLDIVANAIFDI